MAKEINLRVGDYVYIVFFRKRICKKEIESKASLIEVFTNLKKQSGGLNSTSSNVSYSILSASISRN